METIFLIELITVGIDSGKEYYDTEAIGAATSIEKAKELWSKAYAVHGNSGKFFHFVRIRAVPVDNIRTVPVDDIN